MQKLFFRVAIALIVTIAFVQCNDQPKADAGTTPAADSTSVTDNWKLGVQLWTFHKFPFLTAIEKADSAGIKNIEAFSGQPLGGDFKDSFGIRMSADSRTKIKQLLQSKGMTLVAYGVVVPRSPEEWKQTFEFAKDMGIQYITAEPLRKHWQVADSLAGAYGIKIAIHDHPRSSPYDHPDSVIAAMQGHPNLYACADLGHWARNGLDVVECLKKLDGRIIGSHLKDVTTFNNPKSPDTIPGKGVIKFPEVFAEFKRQGFNGMFSIEHESNWDNNVADVKQIVQFYNEQVKNLK